MRRPVSRKSAKCAKVAKERNDFRSESLCALAPLRELLSNGPIGSLAHLGLARAYALEAAAGEGDHAASFGAKARAAYQDFLTLWKDADRDVPILKEARVEYAKLQ